MGALSFYPHRFSAYWLHWGHQPPGPRHRELSTLPTPLDSRIIAWGSICNRHLFVGFRHSKNVGKHWNRNLNTTSKALREQTINDVHSRWWCIDCQLIKSDIVAVLMVQRCRSAQNTMVNSSAPTTAVFQQAGAAMAMLIVTIHQMKLAVVGLSFLHVVLLFTDEIIISTKWTEPMTER